MPVLDGVLPVDKPEGPTSHDVVSRARRALGVRRVGHTGTLDPFASGLILLCVGQATRIAEFLTGMDKTYLATARLGTATDSGDRDGGVLSTSEAWRDVTDAMLEEALEGLRGPLSQVPPALSAKKVDGVPAHRRVRRGEEVTLPPKDVEVYELEVTAFSPPDVRFRVRCSTGTYVRSLARDLGAALGVGAHLTALRRTQVRDFSVDGALSLDEMTDPGRVREAMMGSLQALGHRPRIDVDEAALADLGHGRAVSVEAQADEATVAAAAQGRLVALGAVRDNHFHPRKVLLHG